MEDNLVIKGARENNLKNITLAIPKNKFIVVSGLSGSGKSTLAFDTIYAEGQRRYVESLSVYARQFLEVMDKPQVDSIEGLSPSIAIQQKTTSRNPRSTVGTVTEIYDYMRLLFARIGIPFCPKCDRRISSQSIDMICDTVLREYGGRDAMILAPAVQRKKGTHVKIMEKAKYDGYTRVIIDGEMHDIEEEIPKLERNLWHNIEVVVDDFTFGDEERTRLFEGIQAALEFSGGDVMILDTEGRSESYSQSNSCPYCGITVGELEPRAFSFNSPIGMCDKCNGIGEAEGVNPERMVLNKRKSIAGGAIPMLDINDPRRYMIKIAAQAFGFDLNTPYENLSEEARHIILYGDEREIPVKWTNKGKVETWKEQFTGLNGMIQDAVFDYYYIYQLMEMMPCRACDGRRLKRESQVVRINDKGIMDLCEISIDRCRDFFENIKLSETEAHIARDILKEIRERLDFLINVGLSYLTLNRSSSTLSGGESQRIRLATQIGSNLTGVIYVLDEPTIGLHQRDNDRLISTLKKLRDLGNTVIVVEHDEEVIRSADWVIDLGPGAGTHGGQLVFEGTVEEIARDDSSVTGRYLGDKSLITIRRKKRRKKGDLVLYGASSNNLQNIDVSFPVGLFICVTGVSGSGKSTLVNETLRNGLKAHFKLKHDREGEYDYIDNVDLIDKIVSIDQSPIGKTPRSNPATYIGAYSPIRDIFKSTDAARMRGYASGHFSFNVEKGRCTSCQGNGLRHIEMQFLSDVYVKCTECKGKRFNTEVLKVQYRGKNISDILEMTVDEALDFFKHVPSISRKIQTIYDVGLGYIKLGQSSTTLSGGESQRVKLAAELSKVSTGSTLYVLDEPTTGMHFADVQKLLEVLHRLVSMGNTVIVIEHNMDVIRNSDWVIDLGPEGGDEGGSVVAAGTPEEVSRAPGSYTGRYLKKYIT